MSWFSKKKLTGEFSDNMENLSSAGLAAVGHLPPPPASERKRVSRAERIPLFSDHQIAAFAKISGFERQLRIENISLSGLAFDNAQDLNFHVGDLITMKIVISGKQFECKAKAVRTYQSQIGALFAQAPFEMTAALNHYLQVEIAALRIVAISGDLLKPVPRGMPYWYEGEKKTGLYFVVEHNQVLHFTLSVFGNTVNLESGGVLNFGQLQHDASSGPYESGSKVKWESHWPEAMIALCQRFIRSVPALDAGLRASISAMIAKIPTSP